MGYDSTDSVTANHTTNGSDESSIDKNEYNTSCTRFIHHVKHYTMPSQYTAAKKQSYYYWKAFGLPTTTTAQRFSKRAQAAIAETVTVDNDMI